MKTIKEKNEEFAGMSKVQKRIAIAKDVISQIRAKKFKATPGTYCELKTSQKKLKLSGSVELQTLLEEGAINKCNVCALGGIFMSKVSLGNKFNLNSRYDKIQTHIDDDEMISNLRGIFSELELRTIEYAFEGGDINSSFLGKPMHFHARLRSYSKVYKKSEDRLLAIMENIINNKGKFVPEDLSSNK